MRHGLCCKSQTRSILGVLGIVINFTTHLATKIITLAQTLQCL